MSKNHRYLHWRDVARVRRMALDRAEYRCEKCDKRGRLEVHHTKRLHDGGDPLDPDNLEVLCVHCHIRHHRADNMTPGRKEWLDFVKGLTD